MRTQRSNGSTTYTYTYHGSQLTHMTIGSNSLHFYYDASGMPLSVVYNGATYYYILSLQGDVVAILDSSGVSVVEYTYDAWGRLLSTTGSMSGTLGLHNPLRYRGYVYDRETGLYYLQSRYYNPTICRFISADSIGYLGAGGNPLSYNLFAYCLNNPVNYIDSTGCAVDVVLDIISALTSLFDLICNPSFENLGYVLWDVGAAILPFAPGSYIAKGGKILAKIDNFADGSKFLTGTYNKLKKLYKGFDGIEIHHLIEKRFKTLFSVDPGDFLSIPLTKAAHRIFTNRWRNLHKLGDGLDLFKYGSDYSKITYSMMEKAVNTVYGDMPELLEQVLDWLAKNWRYK